MISSPILKKTIFISLLGHITVFSIFSFSFGPKIPRLNFSSVSFWGTIFYAKPDVMKNRVFNGSDIKEKFPRPAAIVALSKANQEYTLVSRDYLKPSVKLTFNKEKISFKPRVEPTYAFFKKKEPVIMLYPALPYHFLLYFKDRQVVHIEFMFNITSLSIKNSIVIKRKISSGNLEVDLLSMRYIESYLFIQQMGFAPDNWQTVKIELSTKEH